MSTLSVDVCDPKRTWVSHRSAILRAGVAVVLVVLGVGTIWPTALALWALWTTDALKSIGMIVPIVSLVLILRVWKSLNWEAQGSWWGLLILLALALIVRLREQTVMVLILAPEWSLNFPPHSVVVLLYGVGCVLLFGGRRLLRAARFPVLLLPLVNPVPHVFNVYVDLPLQRASAHIARSFAISLGQPLSPDKLRLMFTPNFGMFIAPGCNGIRGAVTMGLIALVAGYLYRFRWRAHALTVLGAILLGYIFNFLRLCALVLFYILALHVPSLQDKAENADYLIGGVLFFIAVYALYELIQKLGESQALPAEQPPPLRERTPTLVWSFYARSVAMGVLALLGCASIAHFFSSTAPNAALMIDETALGKFPQTAGKYTLARAWNENLLTGALLFHWAEYAPKDGGTHISIGVSPMLGSHDTLICHSARGEDPIWHGQTVFGTALEPVSFSTSLFNDGATQFLEATTLCNSTTCGEYSSSRTHLGFVFSRPHPGTLLDQNPERPIPILLRAETTDTTLPARTAQQQLSADLSTFLSSVQLSALTQPYRRP